MSRKDADALARVLRRAGWRVEKGKHWKGYAPDGVGRLTWSSTPSDHRWKRNALAQLKRLGYHPDGTPRDD